MDRVVCNNCGEESIVPTDMDICPLCQFDGGLQDVEQDIEYRTDNE